MGLLNNHFIRAERYLKVDGDGYFTPPAAQFFKRPEFLAVMVYTGLAIGAQNEGSQNKLMAAFLPAATIGYLVCSNSRRITRRDFSSLNDTKTIDTQPDRNSSQTHPVDYATAKLQFGSALRWGSVFGVFSAMKLNQLTGTGHLDTINIGLGIFDFAIASSQLNKAYVMNNVVKGRWVIERKPPKIEDEFKEENEEFVMPAPQMS